MHASQLEACEVVIEVQGIGPGNGVVAIRTVGSGKRGTRGGVHGVIRLAVIGGVAAVRAVTSAPQIPQIRVAGEGAADMALRALHAGMRIGQREYFAVIEVGTRPTRGVMTRTALRDGETLRIAGVGWIGGLVIRGLVTAGIAAIGIRDGGWQIVDVIGVAGGTRSRRG